MKAITVETRISHSLQGGGHAVGLIKDGAAHSERRPWGRQSEALGLTVGDASRKRVSAPIIHTVRHKIRVGSARNYVGEVMYKIVLPAILAILLSNVAIADVVRRDSTPAPYWGAWTTTGPNLSVVQLSAKTYIDSEASCTVKWVSEIPSATGPIYSAYLQCSSRSASTRGQFPVNLVIWPKSSDEIAVGPSFTLLKVFHPCRATAPPPTGVARSREAPLNPGQTGAQEECRLGEDMPH
jgi:hypothetical protein